MKKRIISLILACIMLCAVICACGKKQNTPAATGQNNTVEGEAGEIMSYVGDIAGDFNVSGTSFTWFGPGNVGINAPEKDEESGDTMSDAVYYRQRDIVNYYGLDWENLWEGNGQDVADRATTEVLAGGDSYDLVYGSVRSAGTPMLNNGILKSTDNLEYVDLDNEWWLQSLRDTFSIKDKLYFLIGPIVVNTYTDTNIVLFNKEVTEMYNINDSDLYDSVKAGEWTIDKMFEVASAIPSNPTGNSTYRYIEPVGFPFVFSSGMTVTKFDSDGSPYLEETLPRDLSDLADKLSKVFSDESQSMFSNYDREKMDFNTKYGMTQEEAFSDGRGLFLFAESAAALYLREYDVKFGILPMPKMNSAQDNYYSYANSFGGSAVYFLKTVKDIKLSDAVAESMAALSQIYVKEAYYDKLLRSQAIFDIESRDMLDIIFATKIYDMVDLYAGGNIDSWGPIIVTIDKAIKYDSSTLASSYRANAKMTKSYIKELVRTLDNN